MFMAGWTGLEPAASGVTGRRYNQLNYHPIKQRTFIHDPVRTVNSAPDFRNALRRTEPKGEIVRPIRINRGLPTPPPERDPTCQI